MISAPYVLNKSVIVILFVLVIPLFLTFGVPSLRRYERRRIQMNAMDEMGTIHVGRKDILWTYASIVLQKMGSGLILLPFILRKFSQETVGIWMVFFTVIGLTGLLDFGFNPSFIRNISYIFSGAITLQKKGITPVVAGQKINYNLLKGLIAVMNRFYSRIAWILLLLLFTFGTYYIRFILKNYSGNLREVYISWIVLSLITSYSLRTMYLDALLFGKGLIKRSKQIAVYCQVIYLIIAIILIFFQFNLLAVVCARVVSVLIARYLFYRTIYTKEFKQKLEKAISPPQEEIFKDIAPNAIKVGLTCVGEFCVNQFVMLVGPGYLSLKEMASYGLTQQLIGFISTLASVYYFVYQPKNSQYRMQENTIAIKRIYLQGIILLFTIFFVFSSGLLCFGQWMLNSIGSQTPLLSRGMIAIALLIAGLEANHSNSAGILLTKNEVPFFRASLLSGVATIVLLFLFFEYTELGIWAMILSPGIAQGVYQNWKWPLEVFRDLNITRKDAFFLIPKQVRHCLFKKRKKIR